MRSASLLEQVEINSCHSNSVVIYRNPLELIRPTADVELERGRPRGAFIEAEVVIATTKFGGRVVASCEANLSLIFSLIWVKEVE